MLEEVTDILDGLQAGIVITDSRARIVFANRAACRLTGRSWQSGEQGGSCFGFLFGRSTPCADCPLKSNNGSEKGEQSVTIPREDGDSVYARRFFAVWQGYNVISLNDMTREVNHLRSLELNRKEQQAKNILLERRRQEVSSEQKLLRSILDYLPESVVMVRSSFDIERKNNSLTDVFPGENCRRCYELLGQREPCPDCPAREGFHGLNDIRKSHQLGQSYITESITASPSGSGGLLVFRDTTRQINLIEQIRQQRETITRKGQIMSSLADLGAMMQKEPDQNEVVEFFWDLLFELMEVSKALLLVNDIRAGTIWFTSTRGASEEEVREMSRKYLARDIQNQRENAIEADLDGCRQSKASLLQGRAGSLVGLLLIGGRFGEQEDPELLDLFTEPLGAYLQNCLLSRKLEEKANTDPLTGLYNRGYLNQAIVYEHQKLTELDIDFAVVAADVNMLKKANDVYGHEAGDRLILKVSELLGREVRGTDILARTGGDEFVILLPEAGDAAARSFIRRMEEEVFKDVFIEVGDGEQFPVKISFGSAGSDRFPIVEDLLQEADRRMYEAKESFYKNEARYR